MSKPFAPHAAGDLIWKHSRHIKRKLHSFLLHAWYSGLYSGYYSNIGHYLEPTDTCIIIITMYDDRSDMRGTHRCGVLTDCVDVASPDHTRLRTVLEVKLGSFLIGFAPRPHLLPPPPSLLLVLSALKISSVCTPLHALPCMTEKVCLC